MRVNKLVLVELLQRLGLQGVLGIGLLAAALAALLMGVLPAQWELDRMHAEAQRQAARGAQNAAGERAPQTPTERMNAYFKTFPTETAAADSLQKIYDAATQNSIDLPHGEYALAVDRKASLARYRITLPVRGTYQQMRGFIAAALAAVPTLALDHVDFERQKIGDALIEAKVRMTLFLTTR
jgi:Tfp pilus assembly protein PilO